MTSVRNSTVAVTGGAGFIGSNLLLHLVPRYPETRFVNLDALTYAGNLANLTEIEGADNYRFERVDICDFASLEQCWGRYDFSGVINLAAESHVDRSIIGPAAFIQSNIVGTFNLLELARSSHDRGRPVRFHQVSTDEVFGSLGPTGYFDESSPYRPSSPYSASKAAADHLARAYHTTYDLDVVISNCSNNYGPYQFPEKLVPLMIRNAVAGLELPIYGDGRQIRDWLFVTDHCEALDLVYHRGEPGGTYTIGGHNEVENVELVRTLCRIIDELLGGEPRERLLRYVEDRPGHDRRYAIDPSFIQKSLGWAPKHTLEEGLRMTVQWYLDHADWLKSCLSGDYQEYYDRNYGDR